MGGVGDPSASKPPQPEADKTSASETGATDVELVGEAAVVHAEILGKDEATGRLIVKIEEQKGVFFRGPLPPPEILQAYDEIAPGSASLLFQEFVKQGEHRRNSEATVLTASIEDTRRGQRHAFMVSLLMIASACFCAYIGQPWVGGALVGTSAFGIVAAFIHGRQKGGGRYAVSAGSKQSRKPDPADKREDRSERTE